MMEALLSKDPIVTCLYRRKTDGKFLVCKSKYNKKIGLPIVKILVSNYNIQYGKATSKDVSVQVVNAFRKEFGLDPEILNYYEGTKTSFVNNGLIVNGNNIAFDMTDAGEYKGKPTITQNPSGDYTEVQWMSYNQILELVKTNLFDSSSLYYVLRSREQHRIKPILDSRLSLRVYADKTGLKIYNDPADPMPIKTTNMAGLQKWEETEDYVIYLCKDATMTTVQNYVTGTFQTFQERISDIESSQELMKSYSIEWTEQDSINLINEINNEALVKLEQSVMMLPVDGENEVQPIILEPKTVPTTYECCFRVGNDGIYIGEGYENLVKTGYSWDTSSTKDTNGNLVSTRLNGASNGYIVSLLHANKYNVGDIFSVSYENVSGLEYLDRFEINLKAFGVSVAKNKIKDSFTTPNLVDATTNDNIILKFYNKEDTKLKVVTSKIIITKTSTPKPFVKSIMPSGKFAFVTNASMDEYSLVLKEAIFREHTQVSKNILSFSDTKRIYLQNETVGNTNSKLKDNFFDVLTSTQYSKLQTNVQLSANSSVVARVETDSAWGLISVTPRYETYKERGIDSFTQLLIYKANLTETELKAENGKLDFIQFEL